MERRHDSPAFSDEGQIAARYTCSAAAVSCANPRSEADSALAGTTRLQQARLSLFMCFVYSIFF